MIVFCAAGLGLIQIAGCGESIPTEIGKAGISVTGPNEITISGKRFVMTKKISFVAPTTDRDPIRAETSTTAPSIISFHFGVHGHEEGYPFGAFY